MGQGVKEEIAEGVFERKYLLFIFWCLDGDNLSTSKVEDKVCVTPNFPKPYFVGLPEVWCYFLVLW